MLKKKSKGIKMQLIKLGKKEIIIDDYSIDNSFKVINKFKKKKNIKIFKNAVIEEYLFVEIKLLSKQWEELFFYG